MPILYCLSAIAILKGIIQFLYYHSKDRKYYKTKGIITDNYLDRYGGAAGGYDQLPGYDHYYPVVEYTDKEGTTWKATAREYNPDRPMYDIGQKVSLLVNPNDPTSFIFDEKVDKLLIPFVWIGFGLLGIIVGLVIDR